MALPFVPVRLLEPNVSFPRPPAKPLSVSLSLISVLASCRWRQRSVSNLLVNQQGGASAPSCSLATAKQKLGHVEEGVSPTKHLCNSPPKTKRPARRPGVRNTKK